MIPSGPIPKKMPVPITFSADNELHMNFVGDLAFVVANLIGIDVSIQKKMKFRKKQVRMLTTDIDNLVNPLISI